MRAGHAGKFHFGLHRRNAALNQPRILSSKIRVDDRGLQQVTSERVWKQVRHGKAHLFPFEVCNYDLYAWSEIP